METEIHYTDAAADRRDNLARDYTRVLEAAIVSSKRVPGDRVIEITPSDLDKAAKNFGLLSRKIKRQNIVLIRMGLATGLLVTIFGFLFPQIVRAASERPIQLAIILLGLVSAILFWVFLEYLSIDDATHPSAGEIAEVRESIRRLRAELRGRLATSLGFMFGELSLNPDAFEPVDMDRLEEAVELCWEGYRKLSGAGAPEYMALNNLIFYLSAQGDPASKDFVLSKAREIKEAGEMHNSPDLLLTYCRAVLRYSKDPEELEVAREIAASIAVSPRYASRMRREAELYLATRANGTSKPPGKKLGG